MLQFLNQFLSLLENLGVAPKDVMSLAANPVISVLLFLSVATFLSVKYLRVSLHETVIYLFYLLLLVFRRLIGGSTVLFYTDADESGNIGLNFCNALYDELKKRGLKKVKVVNVEIGDQLLVMPIFPELVKAVIILITDVSTLSNDQKRRHYIQHKIQFFVRHGGIAILGHDTIYRRSRNSILQSLAGCSISNYFYCKEEIGYVKVKDGPRAAHNRQLLDSLPEQMDLDDREVITGNWAQGVEFLYTWKDKPDIPLLTRRSIGSGSVFWCNTGDTSTSGPPTPLAEHGSEYLKVIASLVQYGNIRDRN